MVPLCLGEINSTQKVLVWMSINSMVGCYAIIFHSSYGKYEEKIIKDH